KPAEALIFSILTGIISIVGFWSLFNPLAGSLAFGTIAFYSFFYTLYLKPRTPMNIVIGGAAGSMAPVIAWAAAANSLSVIPLLLFAIIFFWTPPHFWALALCLKEDYKKVSYPMLPVVVGDSETWKQIVKYTVVTLVFSVILSLTGSGIFYLAGAAILGGLFIRKAVNARAAGSIKAARGVFGYSIVYLLALFTAMMIDKGIGL
ncbi:protoheme IX farnesyltransferase, partial [Calditrichota bacterium]